MKQNENIYHDLETFFTIKAIVKDHHVDFEVYKIVCCDEYGENLEYENEDQTWVSLEDAALYLHGYVKWDGCSNWYFDEQDNLMLHFCNQQEAKNIGHILAVMYELTDQLLRTYERI